MSFRVCVNLFRLSAGCQLADWPARVCLWFLAAIVCVCVCFGVRLHSCTAFVSNWNVLSGKLAGGACVTLWGAAKWHIDAFWSLSICRCVSECASSACVCVFLVMVAAGCLEVISHRGATRTQDTGWSLPTPHTRLRSYKWGVSSPPT